MESDLDVTHGTIATVSDGETIVTHEPEIVVEDDPTHHHGASVSDGVYHIVCVIAGSGILQLPYALNQGGWFALLLVVFSAFANEYSGQLLVKCLYFGGSRLKGYSHIGYVAYGYRGRTSVEIFFNMMLLGVPVVYIVLLGLNLSILIGVFTTRGWIIIVSALMLVPFLFFKSLKEVALFSAIGVLSTILAIGTVVYYSVCAIASPSEGRAEVTHKLVDWAMIPSALGSISFSFGGNFVYPEVERSLAQPQKFPLVLSLSMIIITIMYITTAALGYAAYGEKTVSPILNNLPQGFVANFAIAVITAHVLLAIPVLVTTFSLDMERRLGILNPTRPSILKRSESESDPLLTGATAEPPPDHALATFATSHPIPSRSILRLLILTFLCLVALSVPYFDDCMTLLGACANGALIFVLPPLFDFKLYGWSERSAREKIAGVALISVGLFAGFVGGAAALKTLVEDVRRERGGGGFALFLQR
ncbi:transmembrane amino acid transporter protein-domain-containing protein [Cladochytrium replicatum]|nr:transmembrane amino acid transporter protein-domain-containing protein [Cladochytrium replicatum]